MWIFYRLQVKDIKLYCMSFVWTISVDEDDIENMRKTLKLDYESLLKKTKDALTCEYSSGLSYEYKLNSQRTEFQWHYAPDEDITVICIFYIFFLFIFMYFYERVINIM